MNISTENILSELNSKETSKHIGGIVFISALMVTGVFGNSHVLAIYGRKIKPSNHRTFIFVLGMVDMIACCVGMPFVLVDLTHQLTFTMIAMCKIVRFVNYFVGVTSSLLMLVVTIDRYRKVCLPLKWQISDKMAKVACGFVIMFCIGSSWPTLFLFGYSTVETKHENVTGVRCATDDKFVETNYQKLFNTYLIGMVVVTFVVHIVLYISICRALVSHNSRTMKIKTMDSQESFHTIANVNYSISDISIIQTSENLNLESFRIEDNMAKDIGRQSTSSKYKFTESTRNVKNLAKHTLETRRITIIFFSIVVIFMISYIPHLTLKIVVFSTKFLENLCLTGTIIYNTVIWCFFINNMSNTIVYMFLDKKFRLEVRKLYFKRSIR